VVNFFSSETLDAVNDFGGSFFSRFQNDCWYKPVVYLFLENRILGDWWTYSFFLGFANFFPPNHFSRNTIVMGTKPAWCAQILSQGLASLLSFRFLQGFQIVADGLSQIKLSFVQPTSLKQVKAPAILVTRSQSLKSFNTTKAEVFVGYGTRRLDEK